MKDYIEKVKEYSDNLIKKLPKKERNEAVMAYQRFNEYLLRLENRYNELRMLENFIMNVTPDELVKRKITMHSLQLEFVDKIEAFYQQVYASISAFILLLKYIAGKEFGTQMPIYEVSKFLPWYQIKVMIVF